MAIVNPFKAVRTSSVKVTFITSKSCEVYSTLEVNSKFDLLFIKTSVDNGNYQVGFETLHTTIN